MNWDRYRELFPVTERYIFVNHAGVAPLPLPTCEAIKRFAEEACRSGSVNYGRWMGIVEETRELLAEMLNASPREIAFVKNTTHGILIAANGVRWREGDNVIITDAEFPANVYPWLNLRRRGVEVRFARQSPDGRIPFEEIEKLVDERTRVISISFVEFATGFRNDLRRIGEMCRERGIIFVVDAIQGLGVIPLDVREFKIDILSSDSHKWLLGPEGIACFYCREEVLDEIDNPNLGWMSVVDEEDYLNYKLVQKGDARRFEEGSYNTMGIIALNASLKLLMEIGVDRIEGRVLGLLDILIDGLKRKGYRIISPLGSGERSGILSFVREGVDSGGIVKMLRENGVIAACRAGYIRVSPHFYNSEGEMRRILELLP